MLHPDLIDDDCFAHEIATNGLFFFPLLPRELCPFHWISSLFEIFFFFFKRFLEAGIRRARGRYRFSRAVALGPNYWSFGSGFRVSAANTRTKLEWVKRPGPGRGEGDILDGRGAEGKEGRGVSPLPFRLVHPLLRDFEAFGIFFFLNSSFQEESGLRSLHSLDNLMLKRQRPRVDGRIDRMSRPSKRNSMGLISRARKLLYWALYRAGFDLKTWDSTDRDSADFRQEWGDTYELSSDF